MTEENLIFSKIKKKYLNFLRKQEVLGQPFYDKLGQLKNFYIPICNSIYIKFTKNKKKTIIVGLSGGQGSGKTTITQILKIIIGIKYNLDVISFSIDDYYKTQKERLEMSKKISKLFRTRGVPGTHDTSLLLKHLKILKKDFSKPILIPTFDKSTDERNKKNKWKKIKKKPDVVIFEGWCVGAKPQKLKNLKKPINVLEKKEDKNLTWRKKVNNELRLKYKKIFNKIDFLIYLKVPSFNSVIKWRLLQEKKLKKKSKGKKIMSNIQVKNFVMYYERVTKDMFLDLKRNADILIHLDKKHKLKNLKTN